jgi:hypothetical protein
LEPWNPGTLEHWNPGTLEPWNSGTLEHWNPGTKEQQQNLRESAPFKSAKICVKQKAFAKKFDFSIHIKLSLYRILNFLYKRIRLHKDFSEFYTNEKK